ncbi:outer membrane usher protein [Superficieibacter electus]|uniref:Outer membrane usher protein n=1 Tax=Superficieibacter electus TaxID=2022662 RepID=A0A2P5GMK0_9ENTR|nr:outer membrane usher protein [Superficieibacter electus]POP41582.1 outer membrane usher protein [Superficieibacter electus]POP47011.1 outer membrane usher protein [Superficieibacter electus]
MLFRRSLLCLAISATLPFATFAAENAAPATEDNIEFNDQFLLNMGSTVDVSRYAQGNPVLPGIYRVKISLNGKNKTTQDVEFKENGTPRATPCITVMMLRQAGVDTSVLSGGLADDDNVTCVDIKAAYNNATVNFDTAKLTLELTLPQLYVMKVPQGYVDPSLWDEGIPAALVSYNINGWRNETDDDNSDTAYAGLQYGLNFGAWRLRSRGSLNWDSDSGTEYDNQDIYLQRDIPAIKAQLVAGETFTNGDTFDSISLRGLRLYSDDRMRPEGTTTYAPVVRGTANSNAKVTVMQSGNKIYETTVPPGPFELSDLSTTGYGNDIEVTIEESDGSKRTFTVPFSSVTQMLRPGSSRWEFGLGELNDESISDNPQVGYATGYYGINNTFTGYVGVQYTDMDYYAGLLGLAVNTRIGAFALDVTQSHAQIDDLGTMEGQSYRLSYSKVIETTDTSFNVAAYRFSTADYLTLRDAAQLNEDIQDQDHYYDSNEELYANYERKKSQYQVSISQPLEFNDKSYGSFYVTGSWENYWNEDGYTSSYNMGYSNSFSYVSYSLSLQRTYDEDGERDDSIYLNLSIPLSMFSSEGKSLAGFNNLNASMRTDTKGSYGMNNSASGNTEDGQFNYSVSTNTNSGDYGDLNQVSGYGSWRGPYGPLSVSASFSDDSSKQYSANYSGGMVLHSGGLTLAPNSFSDTNPMILVHASGAKGATLGYGQGELNSSGYAIMPYASAYRENSVGLNISTLDADVEVKSTREIAIPRDGAVVRVDFATDEGRSLLLELQRSDNGFIPLGADVRSEKNESVGIVGQAGQAYVRGIEDQGTLRVVWGQGADSSCTVHYQITDSAQKVGMTTFLTNQRCQMP